MNRETNNMQKQSAKYQYLAALVVAKISIGYGIICGWSSPAIFLLTSDDTPLLSGKITMEEASWITSLSLIGALISNILYGFTMKKYGRKGPLLALSVPMIISWLLVLIAKNVYFLYVARVLHGFAVGGVAVVAPVFLLEISDDRIRGAIGSTIILSVHIGVVIAFTLGNYCSYYTTPKFVIILTVLFAVCFTFFPETPTFLKKKNRLTDAEKSFRFYRNNRQTVQNHELIYLEMEKLLGLAVADAQTQNRSVNKSFNWSDLATNPGRKAMIIGAVLAALNQLSGCFALMSYTANIFKDAGSAMSPNVSAVGVTQFIGTIVLIPLVDRAGRKLLYIISTVGVALGFITLGVYMLLQSWQYNVETFNWIPIVSISFVFFIAAWAILTLPFTVIAEVMPMHLKEFGVSFCMALMSICGFIVTKCLPSLCDLIGLHGTIFLFAGVCLLSTVFIILFMPETKGKSYEQIMELLQ